MCALTVSSRRGTDEFACFHALRVRPMRGLEDDTGCIHESAPDEPSCMRAIMAVSSTTPRRSCRESMQTNLVRIAHRCSCDDPRPWMAVRCTLSQRVSLACTLPFNILPAHACTGSAGWRPCEVAGEHDLSGRVSTSGFGIRRKSGNLVHCQ